ncbi:imidazole glycerol phosphate synthase subunit HisH [Phycicoccus endophyticus]|uniref:Imidazole glycerol phosphate synthase subunit HisH n=1 Tax=Phycicoccus endophyticus TaxID=1690220 RepID=A0A7G9R431_9MICO|nr:imidazole glycerol phosphate synthase subunit HisH [Phycicoccus endophyticus]NHI18198.1 imidazole glycerol phosphate synthase subunit HisH [Phycicoccus endophyticus]QNN50356.1 imidazole glycerol phosphate synthase subunit HisH [Phycicoccus endophyticus]GGL25702.1 imidazole glycerol phosphate synthase subunit HisH [Phycicoccus endophyticus]
MSRDVVVLDYGSGNVRSAVRALERVGARVELTADREAALAADGLLVPGVGNFHACMAGLAAADGPTLVRQRVAAGGAVLGVCVGMQVMFDASTEPSTAPLPGVGEWPGTVSRLHAPVVPHMGWSRVEAPEGSVLFAGLESERFYFVHSYAAHTFEPSAAAGHPAARATWATHGERFVAAVEDGPLTATQFHPEKSGSAGLALLENWVRAL